MKKKRNESELGGADYLITLANEAAEAGTPYARQFLSMLESLALDQEQDDAGIVANRPLRDYEEAPVMIIWRAGQAALERDDPEGMLTAFMLGASCLAKWPDYLDMRPEGHPHFILEAK